MATQTWILKCKCMACGMHYAVYTNHPDEWKERVKGGLPYCPECGQLGTTLVLKMEESDQFIFQFVSA